MSATSGREQIGLTSVCLSSICLGTMRLSKVGDAASAAGIIRYAFDNGISSFHASSEYETFPLFAEAWRLADLPRASGASLIAKVAAPHFGENRFSALAFREKIDFYLKSLSIDYLDVVQWLLRHDLDREEERVAILKDQADEIANTVAALKREGKIGACIGFPYSPRVADVLLRADYCDGLALYVNPLECEMNHHIAEAAKVGKRIVAIRPFAAGRLFAETDLGVAEALDYVFNFDSVVTTVVSASSRDHIDALAEYSQPTGA